MTDAPRPKKYYYPNYSPKAERRRRERADIDAGRGKVYDFACRYCGRRFRSTNPYVRYCSQDCRSRSTHLSRCDQIETTRGAERRGRPRRMRPGGLSADE